MLGALVAFVLVLTAAVGGVVLLLRQLEADPPLVARCTASEGDAAASLDPDQAANAALIAAIGVERGLPARAVTIALATAMQESRLRNIDYGDRDSLGLFQQRPSQGWGTEEQVMDPVYSTNAFYDALVRVEGYQDMAITEAAQAVQRSGFPDAYAQHEPMARLFASALTGWSPAALSCRLHDPDDGATALPDLLARDLASASAQPHDGPAGGGEGERALALSLAAGDATRTPWVLAHWAVATADLTGALEVTVGDMRWTRADAAWSPTDTPAPNGVVLVR